MQSSPVSWLRSRFYLFLVIAVAVLVIGGIFLTGRDTGRDDHINPTYLAYKQYSEGGYTHRRTFFPGDSVTFYIANERRDFVATLGRITSNGDFEQRAAFPVVNANSPKSSCSPTQGCDFRPTFSFTIPDDWPSGWYRLEFPVLYAEESRFVDFVVAERAPQSQVLFLFDMQTSEAYNVYAGGSIYGTFAPNGSWHTSWQSSVSFLRPTLRSHNYDLYQDAINTPTWIPHEEEAFRRWIEGHFTIGYISNDSMEELGLDFLSRYPLIIVSGMQEYWSDRQLEMLQSYVRNGGNVLISASEFAYGTVVLDGVNQMSLTGVRPNTSAPDDFFGVSLREGEALSQAHGFKPLIVVNESHWAFENTGFKNGDVMTDVRGFLPGAWLETDAAGKLCITSSALPCEHLDVLAMAPFPADIDRDRPDVEALAQHTNAVVAVIHQSRGTIVTVNSWLTIPHPNNYDPRNSLFIANVITELLGR